MINVPRKFTVNRARQKGAITMFSAVLILILLTEMILYAVQVGVFEQRKSANEVLQKLSFHAADSGIQMAKKFMSRNATSVVDEWITEGRWQLCENRTADTGTDPCYGEPIQALRDGSYFYSYSGYAADITCPPGADARELPLCWSELGADAGERVEVFALLCMLNINPDPSATPRVISPNGCATFDMDPDPRYFMLTLLARGNADCDASGNCTSETLIAEKIASFALGSEDGGTGAPLVARTNVPLSGTVEIVPNPNGGGIGVPISSWINTNTTECPDTAPTDPISPVSGSYATCEAHEWYGVDIMPDDASCPTSTCSCDPNSEKMITYASGNDREMGIDIVPDPDFPCDDLIETMLGLDPDVVRAKADDQGRLLTDCSTLDETSEGLYWISGDTCTLQDQIGSKDNPVLLISAASNTRVSAGAEVFGTLMVTDMEDSSADFTGNGHATIYGAAIMDATMEHFNGTFQIVYVEEIIDDSLNFPLFGAIAGGWTDFHDAWR